MVIRPFVKEDREPLRKIVIATNVFSDEEVEIALELMDSEINDPGQDEYILRTFVDDKGVVRGYYCIGRTPMTTATWDLYWIAVDPAAHGKGIGKRLLDHCEQFVRNEGGRLILVETSSKSSYEPTRKFYLKQKYDLTATIRDYYSEGDDLVVFTKYV